MFVKLLNMSISASWVVLAVILLRLMLKKAPKALHCALWLLVAFRLVCPLSLESSFSLMPTVEAIPEEYLSMEASQQSSQTELNIIDNPLFPEQIQIPSEQTVSQLQTRDVFWTVGWMVGMIAMLLYAAVSYLLLRRRVGPSIPMGKHLRLSDRIDTPFILGIVRPKIYLPCSLEEATAAHVLAHEKAHLARKDHWWKPLGFFLLAVYWFNPVMWLAYILLCRDIEMACDEKVIQSLNADQKKAYSNALLCCSLPRKMIAACPLAFGEVGVKDRIKSVLHYKKPAFWIVLVAVIASIIAALCFLTDPAADSGEALSEFLEKASEGDGYTILNQTSRDIAISIPKSALPDSIYSEKGHTFDEKEIVVYETGTTVFYLSSVRYANEGNDQLYFKFDSAYTIPDSGTLTLLYSSSRNDGVRYTLWVENRDITDDRQVYPDSVSMRGVDGISGGFSGGSFTVYVDTEVCKAAQGSIRFMVNNFTDLTYAKEGSGVSYEDLGSDRLAPGSYVTTELTYWPLYSSYYWEAPPDSVFQVTEDQFYSEHDDQTFGVSWQWRSSAECWEELTFFFDWYALIAETGIQELPSIENGFRYQKIDDTHHLLLIEDDLYLMKGSETGNDLTNVSAILKLEPYDETDVPVTYPESGTDGQSNNLYSTISGQVYDSRSAQDMIVRNAILTNLGVHNEDNIFYAESHQVLSELVACGAATVDGAPTGYTVLDVIAVVMKAERGGSGIPSVEASYEYVNATVTINRYADGTLELAEFQENEWDDLAKYDLTPEKQHCWDQAVRYWGLDTGLMVNQLLHTIASSPLQYSNAQPYIEEHNAEYWDLIYLGEHTLSYCFTKFLSGNGDGLRGEIMAEACRDIGSSMGEYIAFEGQYVNGAGWFEAFHANAMELYEDNGLDALKDSNRASWILLNMLAQTAQPIPADATAELVYSQHHSNNVVLLVDVKFPEHVDVGAMDVVETPKSVLLTYTSERGEQNMPANGITVNSKDAAENTVRFRFTFDLYGQEPTENDFTLTISKIPELARNETLTLSWQADVDDARTYAAESGDSDISLTVSPYRINVEYTYHNYNSLADLRNAITIFDNYSRVLPTGGSFGGSISKYRMTLSIDLSKPVDIDSIKTVRIGGIKLKEVK